MPNIGICSEKGDITTLFINWVVKDSIKINQMRKNDLCRRVFQSNIEKCII